MFGTLASKSIAGSADGVVERPASEIFKFIAPGFFENYTKWCPEVVKLESLSETPVQQSSRGKQLTLDRGVETESSFEVSEYVSDERFVITGLTDPFTSSYQIVPLGPDKCRLVFSFEIKEIDLLMRPFQKLIKRALEEGASRTVGNIKFLLENTQPA